MLFIFGLAIGSFMNVLALRYNGAHFLFDPKVIGGWSRCPHCGKTLRWFELIPLASYIAQRGRCRHCGALIGFHYPLVELLSGLIFAAVPWQLLAFFGPGAVPAEVFYLFSGLWIAALEILLLIAYIDLRLGIVPDELNILLGVAAIFEVIFAAAYLGPERQSFFGAYAPLFGLHGNVWLAHVAGAVFGAGFFGLLVLLTRGKGMGIGDVKLGLPLGFLFGWPDILLLYASAFVVGAVAGIALILFHKGTRKSAVPFVPFLVAGAAFVFFAGLPAVEWYFRIIGL